MTARHYVRNIMLEQGTRGLEGRFSFSQVFTEQGMQSQLSNLNLEADERMLYTTKNNFLRSLGLDSSSEVIVPFARHGLYLSNCT